MTPKVFATLQPGDQVTLARACKAYGFNYRTTQDAWVKRVLVPAGIQGEVTSVKVPFVTGPERYFHCVDFAPDVQLVDESGRDVDILNTHNNKYRVAVSATDLV